VSDGGKATEARQSWRWWGLSVGGEAMTLPGETRAKIRRDIKLILGRHYNCDGYCPSCEGAKAPCIFRRVALVARRALKVKR
jgi:hypothetical protein